TPARRPNVAPVDDGQTDAPDEALEHGLVHSECGRGHAGPGVGEPGRLEHRLDRAVLAERAVEGDEDERRRRRGGETVDRGAGGQRTLAPQRRRIVVAGGGSFAAAMVDGEPPPPTVE